MLLIVTALSLEADPFIRHFGMRRDASCHAFPVFVSEEAILLVSGTGKLSASVGAAWLIARFPREDHSTTLLNVGFCGAIDPELHPGEPIFIHKVHDIDAGRDMYPEVLPGISIRQGSCGCFSHVVTRDGLSDARVTNPSLPELTVCDMESSGIMAAAMRLLPADRVILMKVVSDTLEPHTLDRQRLREFSENAVDPALELVSLATMSFTARDPDVEEVAVSWSAEDAAMFEAVAEAFRLSVSMRHQLRRDIRYCRAIGRDPSPALREILRDTTPVLSKKEGKERYARLKERLVREISGDLYGGIGASECAHAANPREI
jgi:adenosylhomocysteine nucleosidase